MTSSKYDFFDDFDPLTGEPSKYFQEQLSSLTGSFRCSLDQYTSAGIISLIESIFTKFAIEWSEGFGVKIDKEAINKDDFLINSPEAPNFLPYGCFLVCMAMSHDDPEFRLIFPELSDNRWPDFFRIYGLYLVAQMKKEEKLLVEQGATGETIYETLAIYLSKLVEIETMSYYIEQNPETKIRILESNEKRLEGARKGGLNKYADARRIKNQYIEYYLENKDKNKFHSYAQAASKFHSSLSEEDKKHIQPEALVKHLRAYLKEHPEHKMS